MIVEFVLRHEVPVPEATALDGFVGLREATKHCAKDTGLTNLPLHDFAQNQIWCAVVALACELTARIQTLALTGHPGHEAARRWEPKRLRLRLFSIPARAARTG